MRQAWGKTDRRGGTDRTHPLAHHSVDVAAVFLRLLRLPVVKSRLEAAANAELTEVDCQRLAALAFLHDIGKLHPGFQAKGWPLELRPRKIHGHTRESWEFVRLACKWPDHDHPFHNTMRRILEWGPSVDSLLAAVFAHHGRPVDPPPAPSLQGWNFLKAAQYDWKCETSAMTTALLKWFDGAFESDTPPLPNTPQFHHLVAGYAALADWIGSNTEFFPFREPFSLDYDLEAHEKAELALSGIGLDIGKLGRLPAPEFLQLTGFSAPNSAQATVGEVESDTQLVILEAETGSGKTEAALWRFTKLLAAGKVSGLYFAVPTRAAAKQLHGRIDEALKRAFGKAAPEAVLAIPGMLKAGEFEGQRLPHWRVQWNDSATSVPLRWAAEHATRFFGGIRRHRHGGSSLAGGLASEARPPSRQCLEPQPAGGGRGPRIRCLHDRSAETFAGRSFGMRRICDAHVRNAGFQGENTLD